MDANMRYDWRSWGAIASVAWAIAGSNAGMYLAVAPATLAYRNCVESQGTDARECQLNLHRDWAKYSGDRLIYAAFVGLAPIPIGWLIGWLAFTRRRRSPAASNATRAIVRGSALAPQA
jgi:hypothetical protein